MRRTDGSRRPGRGRRAFTLAEVLVAAVLVALGVIALVASLGYESETVQRGEDMTVGIFLAEEIRDMALQMPFASVLDLDDTAFNPAVLSTGDPQAETKYAQTIAVVPVSGDDLAVEVEPDDADAARLAVTVLAHGKPVTTQVYYIFDMAGTVFSDD